ILPHVELAAVPARIVGDCGIGSDGTGPKPIEPGDFGAESGLFGRQAFQFPIDPRRLAGEAMTLIPVIERLVSGPGPQADGGEIRFLCGKARQTLGVVESEDIGHGGAHGINILRPRTSAGRNQHCRCDEVPYATHDCAPWPDICVRMAVRWSLYSRSSLPLERTRTLFRPMRRRKPQLASSTISLRQLSADMASTSRQARLA